MKKIKLFSLLIGVIFTLNQILPSAEALEVFGASKPEVNFPKPFNFELPSELAAVETVSAGSGPVLVHIQEAHGSFEVQKNISKILRILKDRYKTDLILLEGNALELKPQLIRFFPDNAKKTQEIALKLAKNGIVSGPELFFLGEPKARAYGIEDAESYRKNGEAFVKVLKAKEQSRAFLEDMEMQVERLTSPYLNQELRNFLKRTDSFESHLVPLDKWLDEIRKYAKEHAEIDLDNPWFQTEWPMLMRIFTLKKFEDQLDLVKFKKEREDFLKIIRKIPAEIYQPVEKLLGRSLAEGRQSLSDPETGLLFEKMLEYLPKDFDYKAYPNVNKFIGSLILQSELKNSRLADEIELLTDRITEKLAKNEKEKTIAALFKQMVLLKRLFRLELTPDDYEKVELQRENLRPSIMISRFEALNDGGQVKDSKFEHVAEIENLFDAAFEFYRGAKERDGQMIENVEKRMKETGSRSAAVITGGFHSGPFHKHFQEQDYNYALVTPKMTDIKSADGYVQMMLERSRSTYRPSEVVTGDFARNPSWNYLRSQVFPAFGGEQTASRTGWYQSLARAEIRTSRESGVTGRMQTVKELFGEDTDYLLAQAPFLVAHFEGMSEAEWQQAVALQTDPFSFQNQAAEILNAHLQKRIQENQNKTNVLKPGDEAAVRTPARIPFSSVIGSDKPPVAMAQGSRILNLSADISGENPIEVKVRVISDPVIRIKKTDVNSSGEREIIETEIVSMEELLDVSPQDPFFLFKVAFKVSGLFGEDNLGNLAGRLRELGGGFEIETYHHMAQGGGGSNLLYFSFFTALDRILGRPADVQEANRNVLTAEYLIGTWGGWNDHLGGYYPGIKAFEAAPGVLFPEYTELILSAGAQENLHKRLILWDSGQARKGQSHRVAVSTQNLSEGRMKLLRHYGRKLHDEMVDALRNGDLTLTGKLLMQKNTLGNLASPQIDRSYFEETLARVDSLIDGASYIGAGGGGYYIFMAKEGREIELRKELSRMGIINEWNLNRRGAETQFIPSSLRLLNQVREIDEWEKTFKAFEIAAAETPALYENISFRFEGAFSEKINFQVYFPRNLNPDLMKKVYAYVSAQINNRIMSEGAVQVRIQTAVPDFVDNLNRYFDEHYNSPDAATGVSVIVGETLGRPRFLILPEDGTPSHILLPQSDTQPALAPVTAPLKLIAINFGRMMTKVGLLEMDASGKLNYLAGPERFETSPAGTDPSDYAGLAARTQEKIQIMLGASGYTADDFQGVGISVGLGLSGSIDVAEDGTRIQKAGFTGGAFDEQGNPSHDLVNFVIRNFPGKRIHVRNDGDMEALGIARQFGYRKTLVLKFGNELAAAYIDGEGNVSAGINEFGNAVIDFSENAPRHGGTRVSGYAGALISWLGIENIAKEAGLYQKYQFKDADPVPEILKGWAENGTEEQQRDAAIVFQRVGRYIAALKTTLGSYYEIESVVLSGGLLSGKSGALITQEANRILNASTVKTVSDNPAVLKFGALAGLAYQFTAPRAEIRTDSAFLNFLEQQSIFPYQTLQAQMLTDQGFIRAAQRLQQALKQPEARQFIPYAGQYVETYFQTQNTLNLAPDLLFTVPADGSDPQKVLADLFYFVLSDPEIRQVYTAFKKRRGFLQVTFGILAAYSWPAKYFSFLLKENQAPALNILGPRLSFRTKGGLWELSTRAKQLVEQRLVDQGKLQAQTPVQAIEKLKAMHPADWYRYAGANNAGIVAQLSEAVTEAEFFGRFEENPAYQSALGNLEQQFEAALPEIPGIEPIRLWPYQKIHFLAGAARKKWRERQGIRIADDNLLDALAQELAAETETDAFRFKLWQDSLSSLYDPGAEEDDLGYYVGKIAQKAFRNLFGFKPPLYSRINPGSLKSALGRILQRTVERRTAGLPLLEHNVPAPAVIREMIGTPSASFYQSIMNEIGPAVQEALQHSLKDTEQRQFHESRREQLLKNRINLEKELAKRKAEKNDLDNREAGEVYGNQDLLYQKKSEIIALEKNISFIQDQIRKIESALEFRAEIRTESTPARPEDYLKALNSVEASAIFTQEISRKKLLTQGDKGKILKLAGIFEAEAAKGGEDRHLIALLEKTLERIGFDPLRREIETLIRIFRETPPGEPLDKISIKENLAYQALIWWVRSWPKRDVHTHVSPSIQINWQTKFIVANEERLRPLFAEWKAKIDREGKKKDTARYLIMKYFLAKKGAWKFDAATKKAVQKIYQTPDVKEKSDSLDFMVVTNEDFAAAVRHVVRQYFQDGVREVHLQFNPVKEYSASVHETLQAVHAAIAEEEAAANRQFGGNHRVLLDLSFNREKRDVEPVSKGLDEIAEILRRGEPYAWRIHGFDLSGKEIKDGSYYGKRDAWKEIIQKAKAIGLKIKTHIGDRTNTDTEKISIEDQMNLLDEALDLVEPSAVGHAMVLAPLVEIKKEEQTKRGVRFDVNPDLARADLILQKLRERGIAIETTATDAIFDQRDQFRIFHWRRQGVNYIPAVDAFRYHTSTLSQWLVRILLTAPEKEENVPPVTIQEIRDSVSLRPEIRSSEPVTAEEAKRRLAEQEKVPHYAWLDDMDGVLTLPGSKNVSPQILEEYKQDLRQGIIRAFVSGRAESVSAADRERDIHDIEEAASLIRQGLEPEFAANLKAFPENGTYVYWYEWDNGRAELVRKEIDLAQRYGLVQPGYQLSETDRERFYQELSNYVASQGFQLPFKFSEQKRYGMALWVNDIDHKLTEAEISARASQIAPVVREFLAGHPEYSNYEVVATSVTVDVGVKGVDKELAVRFMKEEYGLTDAEIVSADDKAAPDGNGYRFTNRPGGFSIKEYDPASARQIPVLLALGVTNLEARLILREKLRLLPYRPEIRSAAMRENRLRRRSLMVAMDALYELLQKKQGEGRVLEAAHYKDQILDQQKIKLDFKVRLSLPNDPGAVHDLKFALDIRHNDFGITSVVEPAAYDAGFNKRHLMYYSAPERTVINIGATTKHYGNKQPVFSSYKANGEGYPKGHILDISYDSGSDQPVVIVEDALLQSLQEQGLKDPQNENGYQTFLKDLQADGLLISESQAIAMKLADDENLPGVEIVTPQKITFKNAEGLLFLEIEGEQKFQGTFDELVDFLQSKLQKHEPLNILYADPEKGVIAVENNQPAKTILKLKEEPQVLEKTLESVLIARPEIRMASEPLGRVPRPSAKPMDLQKAEEWINAHDPQYRELARFIIQNTKHISQEAFEMALSNVIKRFTEAAQGKPFLLVTQGRTYGQVWKFENPDSITNREFRKFRATVQSGDWVLDVAMENGLRAPERIVKNLDLGARNSDSDEEFARVTKERDDELQQWLLDHPEVEHVLFLDDVSMSGAQVADITRDLFKAIREVKGRKAPLIHIAVPYVTLQAQRRIKELVPGAVLHFEEEVPQLREILKKDPGMQRLARQLYIARYPRKSLNEELDEDGILTYWDHKITDNTLAHPWAKGGSRDEERETFLHGAVEKDWNSQVQRAGMLRMLPFVSGASEREIYRSRDYYIYKLRQYHAANPRSEIRTMEHKLRRELVKQVTEVFDVVKKAYGVGGGVEIKDNNTPVTAADYLTQMVVKTLLWKIYPEQPVVGEEVLKLEQLEAFLAKNSPIGHYLRENGKSAVLKRYRRILKEYKKINGHQDIIIKDGKGPKKLWILDPLDGTRSFATGKNTYGIVIGRYEWDEESKLYKPSINIGYAPEYEVAYPQRGAGAVIRGPLLEYIAGKTVHLYETTAPGRVKRVTGDLARHQEALQTFLFRESPSQGPDPYGGIGRELIKQTGQEYREVWVRDVSQRMEGVIGNLSLFTSPDQLWDHAGLLGIIQATGGKLYRTFPGRFHGEEVKGYRLRDIQEALKPEGERFPILVAYGKQNQQIAEKMLQEMKQKAFYPEKWKSKDDWKYTATISKSGAVRIWNTQTLQPAAPAYETKEPASALRTLTFSDDGKHLIAVFGTGRVFSIDTQTGKARKYNVQAKRLAAKIASLKSKRSEIREKEGSPRIGMTEEQQSQLINYVTEIGQEMARGNMPDKSAISEKLNLFEKDGAVHAALVELLDTLLKYKEETTWQNLASVRWAMQTLNKKWLRSAGHHLFFNPSKPDLEKPLFPLVTVFGPIAKISRYKGNNGKIFKVIHVLNRIDLPVAEQEKTLFPFGGINTSSRGRRITPIVVQHPEKTRYEKTTAGLPERIRELRAKDPNTLNSLDPLILMAHEGMDFEGPELDAGVQREYYSHVEWEEAVHYNNRGFIPRTWNDGEKVHDIYFGPDDVVVKILDKMPPSEREVAAYNAADEMAPLIAHLMRENQQVWLELHQILHRTAIALKVIPSEQSSNPHYLAAVPVTQALLRYLNRELPGKPFEKHIAVNSFSDLSLETLREEILKPLVNDAAKGVLTLKHLKSFAEETFREKFGVSLQLEKVSEENFPVRRSEIRTIEFPKAGEPGFEELSYLKQMVDRKITESLDPAFMKLDFSSVLEELIPGLKNAEKGSTDLAAETVLETVLYNLYTSALFLWNASQRAGFEEEPQDILRLLGFPSAGDIRSNSYELFKIYTQKILMPLLENTANENLVLFMLSTQAKSVRGFLKNINARPPVDDATLNYYHTPTLFVPDVQFFMDLIHQWDSEGFSSWFFPELGLFVEKRNGMPQSAVLNLREAVKMIAETRWPERRPETVAASSILPADIMMAESAFHLAVEIIAYNVSEATLRKEIYKELDEMDNDDSVFELPRFMLPLRPDSFQELRKQRKYGLHDALLDLEVWISRSELTLHLIENDALKAAGHLEGTRKILTEFPSLFKSIEEAFPVYRQKAAQWYVLGDTRMDDAHVWLNDLKQRFESVKERTDRSEIRTAVENLAENYTGFLVLESVRQESPELFEQIVKELAQRHNFAVKQQGIETLAPEVKAFLNSESGRPLRGLFAPSDSAVPSRMIRVKKAPVAEMAVPILRSILDRNFKYIVVADNAGEAQDLKVEARTYARDHLHLNLNEDRFLVVTRNVRGLVPTLNSLIVKGERVSIVADGKAGDEIAKAFDSLNVNGNSLRLIDNTELTVAEEMVLSATLLDEESYRISRQVQYTSQHVSGPLANLLAQAKALAAILKAA